ncbi:MAG: flagellar hook-associated protein FlgK [Gammaproteobacteria bacterium]|nr:flagellar hook-associated protein FlgK [Gammaproteobacteria bacterium]
MSDLLGTGLTGLKAFQSALSTTGNNISNVNTEGYSRQQVRLTTLPSQYTGAGYVGRGVGVDSIERVYDDYLVKEVRVNISSSAEYSAYNAFASRVSDSLSDASIGMNGALNSFFNSVQAVSNNPSTLSERYVMMSDAEGLVNRFNSLDSYMQGLKEDVKLAISSAVNDINIYAESVAQLNKQISSSFGLASDNLPNDLIDQRDLLIERISESVSVRILEQADGSVNVFVGSGQGLVVGDRSNLLGVSDDAFDTSGVDIVFDNGVSTSSITSQISGGSMAGLLRFKNEVLDPSYNALGRMATVLGAAFNAQHADGMSLDGVIGSNFFSGVDAGVAISNINNKGSYDLGISITDTDMLTVSDYRLDYNGSLYTLTRLSDSSVVTSSAGLPIDVTTTDGFSISLAGGTDIRAGDSFLIRPTRNAATNISVALRDVREIAAAVPIRTSSASANTSNAGISSGAITDIANANVLTTANILFSNATTYTINGGANQALPASGVISQNGWQVTISGVPAAGDTFTVQNNTGGTGDNRNMLSLAALQNTRMLDNGLNSIGGAYSSMLADIGSKTRLSQLAKEAQTAMLDRAQEARSAVSGVNLDEEAADLVRFQQAYQAAAQVVSISDTLFQTILSMARR